MKKWCLPYNGDNLVTTPSYLSKKDIPNTYLKTVLEEEVDRIIPSIIYGRQSYKNYCEALAAPYNVVFVDGREYREYFEPEKKEQKFFTTEELLGLLVGKQFTFM